MTEAKSSRDIGMKRGRILADLPTSEQFDLIAEGLPILLKSSENLLLASEQLRDHPRAASILEGHAIEELSKVLILVDIVRSPPALRIQRAGTMMNWWYDHLARLIYADAQTWKPVNVEQLQEYVDDQRKSHYLEGSVGEYVIPNWTIFSRESQLYADIITYESGDPVWNEPWGEPMFNRGRPPTWETCAALRDFGALSRPGLDIMADVWGEVDFINKQNKSDACNLTESMLNKLDASKLITSAAKQEQLRSLYHCWQMPMYRIDFKRINVPLEDLQAQRNANIWSEIGYQG